MDYLLDTNIMLLYLRKSEIKEEMERRLHLFQPSNTLVISVVSIGEIKSIALRRKWGEARQVQLEALLRKLLVADINAEAIIDRYAEMDAYSQAGIKEGRIAFTARNMGKNDLWIAATASVLKAKLITTDKDFSHLDGHFIDLIELDIEEIKLTLSQGKAD